MQSLSPAVISALQTLVASLREARAQAPAGSACCRRRWSGGSAAAGRRSHWDRGRCRRLYSLRASASAAEGGELDDEARAGRGLLPRPASWRVPVRAAARRLDGGDLGFRPGRPASGFAARAAEQVHDRALLLLGAGRRRCIAARSMGVAGGGLRVIGHGLGGRHQHHRLSAQVLLRQVFFFAGCLQPASSWAAAAAGSAVGIFRCGAGSTRCRCAPKQVPPRRWLFPGAAEEAVTRRGEWSCSAMAWREAPCDPCPAPPRRRRCAASVLLSMLPCSPAAAATAAAAAHRPSAGPGFRALDRRVRRRDRVGARWQPAPRQRAGLRPAATGISSVGCTWPPITSWSPTIRS